MFLCSFLEEIPIGARDIREATKTDSTLSLVLKYTLEGWPRCLDQSQRELRPYFNQKEYLSVEQGCILLGYRVTISAKYCGRLLNELHNDHPGICKMPWLDPIYGGRHLIKTLKQNLSHVLYVVQCRTHLSPHHCTLGLGLPESGKDYILIMHRKKTATF